MGVTAKMSQTAVRLVLGMLAGVAITVAGGCVSTNPGTTFPTVGQIHRVHAGLDALIAPDAPIERLAGDFRWSEGPVWIPDGRYLLLSDVPANTMYRWSEKEGLSVFLNPSGGAAKDGFREAGSNGLIRGEGNSILLADHGNRALARLDLASREKTFLATRFQGKRFNSPNDLVRASDGSIYFTDPPYGLEGMDKSPLKELAHNGVYRLMPSGEVLLVDDGLTFPNGIVLSPDERTLYVAVSDPAAPRIYAYPLDDAGRAGERRMIADFSAEVAAKQPGLPDGMAVDTRGNIWATGPGGVHVLSPDGARLGRIDTGTAIANCAFGEDGRTLFLASNSFLARVRTRVSGLGPEVAPARRSRR
jgi:gluconolactonase